MDDRAGHSINLLAGAGDSLMGNVLAFLVEHSALFRYRYVLHQLLLRGGYVVPHPDVYFDERGFHAIERSLADFSSSDRLQAQNRAGVLNYNPQGEQADALRAMIATIRSHNAQPVLVAFPLSDEYYSNFDTPADYQKYRTALQQLADELNVPLWDMEAPATLEPFADTEFGDLNHLNEVGAERLSTALGQYYAALVQADGGQTARP
jgi:lysophospholipase L1-like esterase